MIPCPSCGTRNRRGSKYCYRCGQRMDIVFDVSCPACDRLNPVGSTFCAFCGVQIPALLPAGGPVVAEGPAVAERAAPMPQESLESQPERVEPAVEPQRELPPWLYEESGAQPETAAVPSTVSPPPAAELPSGGSKYLSDIPGALPKTEGWLASVKPAVNQVPQSNRKARAGCWTLALLALSGAVALVLMSVM